MLTVTYMAKDDYYVIVGKILVFLYSKLKGKTSKNTEEYLAPCTGDFPISQEYWDFVIQSMHERHLIAGLWQLVAPDGSILEAHVIENTHITVEGIDFLQDNSKIRKVLRLIPMAAQIADLWR